MNNILEIEYPDSLMFSLKESKNQLENEMKFLLGLKLFELGKVSSGIAAEIAGISRKEFLLKCASYKVSIFSDDNEDLQKEFDYVKNSY